MKNDTGSNNIDVIMISDMNNLGDHEVDEPHLRPHVPYEFIPLGNKIYIICHLN